MTPGTQLVNFARSTRRLWCVDRSNILTTSLSSVAYFILAIARDDDIELFVCLVRVEERCILASSQTLQRCLCTCHTEFLTYINVALL